jgi:regulator of RNase E activity RraB
MGISMVVRVSFTVMGLVVSIPRNTLKVSWAAATLDVSFIAERTYQERFENRVQEAAEEMVQARLEKREERKKNTEETDLRDHLRGFARTIPSFLMAYGNENTTLYNFEHKADAKEFEELTSITKEDFRKLRDGFNYVNENGEEKRYEGFFDEIVFNASIQEFLAKKEALSDYFDEAVQEDIFDYIPAQKNQSDIHP